MNSGSRMIRDAQHDALLARIMALEATLVAAKLTSRRELRLAQQKAARRLKEQQERTDDWIRRQQR